MMIDDDDLSSDTLGCYTATIKAACINQTAVEGQVCETFAANFIVSF